jgi:hypothetical protein
MVREHLLNTSVRGALSRVPLNTADQFAQVSLPKLDHGTRLT